MARQPIDESSYIMLLLYLIIQISQYARYFFFPRPPLPPRLSSAWSIIHGLHGKLIPLLNTPHFRNFNYRRRRAGGGWEKEKKGMRHPLWRRERAITAAGCRSRVSGGPFIDTTSGQMAAGDNRPVYEVCLCGHQELKCIKAGNRVVTTDPPTPGNKLGTLGLRGPRRLKRYLSGSELAAPTSRPRWRENPSDTLCSHNICLVQWDWNFPLGAQKWLNKRLPPLFRSLLGTRRSINTRWTKWRRSDPVEDKHSALLIFPLAVFLVFFFFLQTWALFPVGWNVPRRHRAVRLKKEKKKEKKKGQSNLYVTRRVWWLCHRLRGRTRTARKKSAHACARTPIRACATHAFVHTAQQQATFRKWFFAITAFWCVFTVHRDAEVK